MAACIRGMADTTVLMAMYGTAGGGYGMYGNNEESAIVRRAEVREKIENSIIKRKA